MDQQRTELRHVAWRDLCPWLMLFRCPALALRVETLFLAAVGGVLTSLVWWGGARIFDEAAGPIAPGEPWGQMLWRVVVLGASVPTTVQWPGLPPPLRQVFSLDATLAQFAFVVCGGLLTLLIWTVIGGAISRSAAVQLARDERISLRQSLSFAAGKFTSYFFAPLFPLLGVAFFAVVVFLFVGLPMNLDAGLVWAGVVWILVLLSGILVGVLLLGLALGWPLMWATISSEGSDAFDALSRSYAYTLQRPLHYLFFAALAAGLGLLTWALVLMFGEAVIHLSWWSADWGVFDERRMADLVAAADGRQPAGDPAGTLGQFGITLLGLANAALRWVAFSFIYGYLWVAAAAIYLLLRREVDHTETDEVHLDDHSDEYGLPPLKDDEAGVPDVIEDPQ